MPQVYVAQAKTKNGLESRIVLLCGIPCTGKSHYAAWLEREKGFVHLDVDKLEAQWRAGLKASWKGTLWKRALEPGGVEALRQITRPVVIDWGFPPRLLSVVSALKRDGVQIWWFDGDRDAAQQCFVQRAMVSERLTGRLLEERIDQFNRQMSSIANAWSGIQSVAGSHIIEAMKPGPSFASPEQIFERMFSSAAQMSLTST